jgi:hypothetical protein
VASWDDVRRIALGLSETGGQLSHGRLAWRAQRSVGTVGVSSAVMTLEVALFTDPACPFAFSAEPLRLRLAWE